MRALCLLSKDLESQRSQHLDTRRRVPPQSFGLHLILGVGGGRENMLQSQDAVGGRGVPDKPKKKPHTLWEEKVYTCLCNKAKQMETLEEKQAAKNITTRLTNTHSFPH